MDPWWLREWFKSVEKRTHGRLGHSDWPVDVSVFFFLYFFSSCVLKPIKLGIGKKRCFKKYIIMGERCVFLRHNFVSKTTFISHVLTTYDKSQQSLQCFLLFHLFSSFIWCSIYLFLSLCHCPWLCAPWWTNVLLLCGLDSSEVVYSSVWFSVSQCHFSLLPPASGEGEREEAGGRGEAEEGEGCEREGRARETGTTAEEEEVAGCQRR